MMKVQIPDSIDPFVPHVKVLTVCSVGDVVFLDIDRYEEDNVSSTSTTVEGISVDAQSLVDALFTTANHEQRAQLRRTLTKHCDENYDKGSPFRADHQPMSDEYLALLRLAGAARTFAMTGDSSVLDAALDELNEVQSH